MSIRAVYFDLGGVIVRTGDKTSRTRLGAEFGMSYDEMDKFVFGCKTAALASLGKMSEKEHWLDVTRRLNRPENDMPRIRKAFFDGDSLDHDLVELLRGLRKTHKTGLISNAWDDLRSWIISQKFEDAFDDLTISAEVGVVKPEARIYEIALDKLGVAANEAIFVDDMPQNIKGCEALGMHGILFRYPAQVKADIENIMNS
jgi:epoxide hydrolase-like predicted phosphatase